MQAGSLEIGERLQTLSGDVKVVQQKLPRPGPEPVFNPEVHAEHVYFVGEDGVLVHNEQGYDEIAKIAEKHGGEILEGESYGFAFMFPNRKAASAAASEISGDLGPNPTKIRLPEYREPTLPWTAQHSHRVIGKHSNEVDTFMDPIAGYHDHHLGHSAFGEVRPHINAGGRHGTTFKDNAHLFYRTQE